MLGPMYSSESGDQEAGDDDDGNDFAGFGSDSEAGDCIDGDSMAGDSIDGDFMNSHPDSEDRDSTTSEECTCNRLTQAIKSLNTRLLGAVLVGAPEFEIKVLRDTLRTLTGLDELLARFD